VISNHIGELLEHLPLVFTHGDVNGLNILANGDRDISGVIDWKESSWKSFGFDFYGLSTFLENVKDTTTARELEKVFKKISWDSLPPKLQSVKNCKGL
jgi:Ser/Thr protein kinase RdoA (MazF antagonist)